MSARPRRAMAQDSSAAAGTKDATEPLLPFDSPDHMLPDPGLCDYEDLRDRDNEYIVSGYRKASGSWKSSIASIFAIHNETVNIHSHLFGGLLFFTLPIYAYYKVYPRQATAGVADILVFAAFFYGVSVCYFLSSIFHIINNHSPRINIIGNQLDYLGVVLLMWGATIPTVYYGFFDDKRLQVVYWIVVSTLGVGCAVATFHPIFRTPAFRPYRAGMYAMLGLSAIGFVVHGIAKYGLHIANRRMALEWMLLMATFNLVGAGLYGTRVPEKLKPGTFDTCGSSHQVLHFMVIFAGLAHMVGLFKAFDYAHTVTLAGKEHTL